MNIVAASLAEHQYERAAGLLQEVMPLPGEAIDHRCFEWYNVWNSLHKAKLRSFRIAENPQQMQLSADGSILAAQCGSNVLIYRMPDVERLLTLPSNRFATYFALARDGSFLAFKDGKTIEIWSLPAKGKPEARLTIKAFDNTHVNALALSADQRRIVATGDYGRIRVFDVGDGQRLDDIEQYVDKKGSFSSIDKLSMSRDGKWIAYNSRGRLVLFNLETKSEAKLEQPPGEYPRIEITDADTVVARTSAQVWSWPLPAPHGVTFGTARKLPASKEWSEVWEEPAPAGEGPLTYIRGARRVEGYRTPIGRDYFALIRRTAAQGTDARLLQHSRGPRSHDVRGAAGPQGPGLRGSDRPGDAARRRQGRRARIAAAPSQ